MSQPLLGLGGSGYLMFCGQRKRCFPHHDFQKRLFFVSGRSIILLPIKEVNERGYGYSACHQTRPSISCPGRFRT